MSRWKGLPESFISRRFLLDKETGSAVFFGIGDDYRSDPVPAEIPLIIIHSLKNLKLLVLCKLALFLNLKEGFIVS